MKKTFSQSLSRLLFPSANTVKTRLAMIAVLFTVAALHCSAICNEFHFDDRPQILEGRLNRSWSSITTIFASEVWRNVESEERLKDARVDTFRPLFNLSLLIDYQIAGLSPPFYHAVNMVIHLINVFVIFMIARRFFTDPIAIFTAFLFGVHPATVTCIHYVSARPDSASTLFALVTVALAVRFERFSVPRLAGMTLSFLAAMLWKETAIFTPILAPIFYWTATEKPSLRHAGIISAVLLATLAIYFALRLNALQSLKAVEDSSHLLTMILNYPRAVFHWLQVALMIRSPMPLHAFNPIAPPVGAALMAMTAAFYLLLGAVVVLGVRYRCLAIAAFTWVLLSMAPPIAAIVRTDIIDGHYFYQSTAGTALLIGVLFRSHVFSRVAAKWTIAFGAALIVSAATLSFVSGRAYRTEVSFYRAIIAAGPHSPVAAYNLGNALMRAKRVDDAITQYRKVLRAYSGHPKAGTHNNLSVALLQVGQADEALHHARRAVSLSPRNARYHYNLALVHLQKRQWNALGFSLGQALTHNRDYKDARELARQLCASRHRGVLKQLCAPSETKKRQSLSTD